MPLTPKGRKIEGAMEKEYGEKKGEQVFYASINKGKIKGAHEKALRAKEAIHGSGKGKKVEGGHHLGY